MAKSLAPRRGRPPKNRQGRSGQNGAASRPAPLILKPSLQTESPTENLIPTLADPRFFIETYFWIIDKNRNKIPFKFNLPQRKYYAERSKCDLILKARKEGISTLVEALFLFECLHFENINAVTMAHTLEDTLIHMDRIEFFLRTIGTDKFKFKIETARENQKEIHFADTNSHYWVGTAGSRNFGRGRDLTHCHLSEVALYEDQSVLSAVMEACVPNATKILESTANGVGELFHKLWQEAEDPEMQSPWKQHFFPWFADPTNVREIPIDVDVRITDKEEKLVRQHNLSKEQIYWYRMKSKEMAEKEKLVQEYPSTAQESFLSSGRHVFDLAKIQDKKQFCSKPMHRVNLMDDGKKIHTVVNPEGILKIWKMPREDGYYLISADVAEGIQDGDWSVAHVLDRSSWEQVAVLRTRMNPGLWGKELCKLGYLYNNALLAPEVNNQGWSTVEAIKNVGYPHLLRTSELWKDEQPRDGFPTTVKTKGQIITALRIALDQDTVFINDVTTLREMETYIVNDAGQMEAQQNSFDDCVTSLAIGVYCLKFLNLDRTYADRNQLRGNMPLIDVTSLVGEYGNKEQISRRSSTGYR